MKSKMILAMLGLAALLTSCAPTKDEYDTITTAMEGSKKLQTAVLRKCLENPMTAEERKNSAIVLDASEKDVKQLLCKRVVSALASKRLSYEDVVAISRNRFSPKVIKILQGR